MIVEKLIGLDGTLSQIEDAELGTMFVVDHKS